MIGSMVPMVDNVKLMQRLGKQDENKLEAKHKLDKNTLRSSILRRWFT